MTRLMPPVRHTQHLPLRVDTGKVNTVLPGAGVGGSTTSCLTLTADVVTSATWQGVWPGAGVAASLFTWGAGLRLTGVVREQPGDTATRTVVERGCRERDTGQWESSKVVNGKVAL